MKRPVRKLSQDEFHQLDYHVMRTAFDIHNEFGRLLEEEVYKTELVYRLCERGLRAEREFPIELSFRGFRTKRYVDVLVENAAVYEVKSAAALAPAHRNQALNYLFLTDTEHGKLVNFGPGKVESEFVSTTLNEDRRRSLEYRTDEWFDDDRSKVLKSITTDLLNDWGGFLDLLLYREALTHLLDGPHHQESSVILECRGRQVGNHKVPLLTDDSMWTLTASKEPKAMRGHLRRFLNLTPLKRLHWINLNRRVIDFVTLCKEP
ncbi:MAG TPA: GxxExxY protein [Pirellulaceae bacterium]|nr:GxxExxY protein [Pirellulaceae bacterium]